MYRRSFTHRVPIQFFNETFFKPKQVLKLNPENYEKHFSNASILPQDATLVRRHRAKFYIVHNANVIGIYSPMMCLPMPRRVPPGGMSITEYLQFLKENDRVFLMVCCKTSIMMALVNKQGSVMAMHGGGGNFSNLELDEEDNVVIGGGSSTKATTETLNPGDTTTNAAAAAASSGDDISSSESKAASAASAVPNKPANFIALPNENTSIQIDEHSKFWENFFNYIRTNYEEIDQATTFWLKKGDNNMWSDLCRMQKGTYDDACPLNFSEDPRWIPTTPMMYFPRLYDYKKRRLNSTGAVDCMKYGELALV